MNSTEAKRRLQSVLDAAREEAEPLPDGFEGHWIIHWCMLCRDALEAGKPPPSLHIVPSNPPSLREICASLTDKHLAEEEAADPD